MTIEEKSKRIETWCDRHCKDYGCTNTCPLFDLDDGTCFTVRDDSDRQVVERHYDILFGDSVNHPSHYTKGKIEVADFIADQKLNFDRGNAIKYVCRAGAKDPEKEIQDLEKAIWYIEHEIKMLKGEDADAAQKEN